jgi:apolipoprotein D and lipocalin family protein
MSHTGLALVSVAAGTISIVAGAISAALWKHRPAKAPVKVQALQGLKPVQSLDLDKYKGIWYEQRRLDSWFEQGLDYVTAKYEPLANGFIKVTNEGFIGAGGGGAAKTSVGMARKTSVEGYLLVSFFPLVEGDYVVLHFDENTAIVGSPNRKFLWLLTRAPQGTAKQFELLKQTALNNKYTEEQLKTLRTVLQKTT